MVAVVGVATLNGKVYVIGGWSGQSGLADCEMYDPSQADAKWKAIARLNTGRGHILKYYTSGNHYQMLTNMKYFCCHDVILYLILRSSCHHESSLEISLRHLEN